MANKRLSKREIREQQELNMLAAKNQQDGELEEGEEQEDEPEDEITQPVQKSASTKSAFAMLMDQQDDADEEEEDQEESEAETADLTSTAVPSKASKKKKKNKKKKKVNASPEDEPEQEQVNQDESEAVKEEKDEILESNQTQLSKSKPKKKKKKSLTTNDESSSKSPNKSKNLDDMSMDELSSLLASSSTNSSTNSNQQVNSELSSLSKSPLSQLRRTLLINPPCLDPSIELRKTFGSAAIKAFASSEGGNSNAGMSSGRARAMAQSRDLNMKGRCILIRPGDNWPAISRTFTGLEMRSKEIGKEKSTGEEEEEEIGNGKEKEKKSALGTGQKQFWWEHSRAYRQVQMQFVQATKSFDTEALTALWRVYPWHIDTLLQLSEVSRHQGDLGQAGDFVSRALFSFERTDGCNFVKSFLQPNSNFVNFIPIHSDNQDPLPFEKIENRAFYLAAHRHVSYLGRRGVWRTTLEWCKFLMGVNLKDPHAMVLWLDFLAVKSGQGSWLLDFYEKLETLKGGENCWDWNVGMAFSKALALREVEKEEKDKTGTRSTEALRRAISLHPYVVEPMLSKINLSLPSSLSSTNHPSPSSIQEILSLIYVNRSNSLWKPTSIANWFLSTAVEIFSSSTSKLNQKLPSPSHEEELSFYRHIIVSDLPDDLRQQLIRLVPSEIVGNGEALNASDPLPPPNHTSYDDAYFSNADLGGRRGGRHSQQQNAANAQAIRAQQQIAQLGSHGIFELLLTQLTSRLESGNLPANEREEMENMRNELEELRNQLAGMDERTRVEILTPLVLGMGAHPGVMAGNAGGAMPGGFGDDIVEDDETDEEEDEEDGQEPAAGGGGGGWLAGWFGRGNQ